jgi:hypothetical protein
MPTTVTYAARILPSTGVIEPGVNPRVQH